MKAQSVVPAKRGLSKHLVGWEVGLGMALCGLVVATLVVPRPVNAPDFPLPRVNRSLERDAGRRDRTLAGTVFGKPLHYNARAVGEALRRYGAIRAGGPGESVQWARRDLTRAVQTAFERGQTEELPRLRALQSTLFLAAVKRWEQGYPSRDLEELGGEFGGEATKHGWRAAGLVKASSAELRAWFLIRWSTLTETLDHPALMPTLNDWRTYYRFLLRSDHQPAVSDRQRLEFRLRVVEAAGRHDPDFPVELARGILLTRLSKYTEARAALLGYLRQHRDGEWQLRARNALAACNTELTR